MSYKENIIKLRKEGKSYREIEDELNCSKGVVSYHCRNEGLGDIGLKGGHGESKNKICPNCHQEFSTPASLDRTYCCNDCFLESDKESIDYSNCGGRRQGSGLSNGCWYKPNRRDSVWLDSTYELAFAEWLDKKDYKWERNTSKFTYSYKDKKRNYIPDFYLPDKELYIEIKGYKTEKDEAKWNNFSENLEVLYKEDLLELGCNLK